MSIEITTVGTPEEHERARAIARAWMAGVKLGMEKAMADKPNANADEKTMRKEATDAGIPVEKTGETAKTHSVTDLMETGPKAQKEYIETHKP